MATAGVGRSLSSHGNAAPPGPAAGGAGGRHSPADDDAPVLRVGVRGCPSNQGHLNTGPNYRLGALIVQTERSP